MQQIGYAFELQPLPAKESTPLSLAGNNKMLSAAQQSNLAAIATINADAEAFRLAQNPIWENLRAVARAMEMIDIDISRRNIGDLNSLQGLAAAKLRAIELLYEEAKRLTKAEMVSLVFYLSKLTDGIEDLLFYGWGYANSENGEHYREDSYDEEYYGDDEVDDAEYSEEIERKRLEEIDVDDKMDEDLAESGAGYGLSIVNYGV